MTRSLRSFVAAIAACVPFVLFTRDAHADPEISARAEVAPSLSSSAKVGVGGDLRLGYVIDLPVLFVTPEVGLGYHRFTGSAAPDVSVAAPYVGARVGIGSMFRPYVDAHVGGAHRSYDAPGGNADGWTPYFDGGVGLGIRIIHSVEFGFHGNLAFSPSTTTTPELDWFGAGIDASIIF